MTDLYLIRHAQPAGERSLNPGLSPLGVTQAEHLRNRLAATGEINADVLISSPLRRARETAEIIAPALGLPVTLDDGVREFYLGECDGLSGEEIVAAFGLVDFEREPDRPVAPGGETWAGFTGRVSGAFERLTRIYQGKTMVIVAHDGVIAASFLSFFGLSALKFVKGLFRPAFGQLYTNTTSITYWHKSEFRDLPTKQEPQWTLVRYNDDVHLYDLGAPAPFPWQTIAPRFGRGPGGRPVQVRVE